jgi:hypothetical protein
MFSHPGVNAWAREKDEIRAASPTTQKKQELRRYFTTSPLVARTTWEDTKTSILVKNSAPIKTLDRVTD